MSGLICTTIMRLVSIIVIWTALLRVGCDGIVGSGATNDQCGVCQGDNSTCRIISGIFMRPYLRYGYNIISKIPAGSCSINITESRRSRNYLALKQSGGDYILNGNWRQSRSGQYKAVGTSFTYNKYRSRTCPGQCIFAHGPTNRTIELQLLSYAKNPGIHYSFTVPLEMVDKVMTDMLSSSGSETSTARNDATGHHHRRNHGNRGPNRNGHRGGHLPTSEQRPKIQHQPAPQKLDSQSQRQGQASYNAQALHSGRSSSPSRHRKTQTSQSRYRSHYGSRYLPASSNQRSYLPSGSRQHHGRNSHLGGTRGQFHHQQPNLRKLQYGQQPRYVSPYEPQQQRVSYRYDSGRLSSGRYQAPEYVPPRSPVRQSLNSNVQTPGSPSQNSVPDSNKLLPNRFDHQGHPYVGDALNPRIQPPAPETDIVYSWRIAGFTECSESCAGGLQETRVVCMKGRSEVIVTDENCEAASRPQSNVISCNTQPCPPEWFADEWGPCSVTCGEGTQSRLVECRKKISDSLSVSVSADLCRDQTRPIAYDQCSYKPCSDWQIGEWTKCSADCGLGQRTRDVMCVDSDGGRLPASHCQGIQPPSEEVCDMGSCAKDWFFTRWSKECSSECGEGFHVRKVFCSADDGTNLPESRCPTHKPRTKKHCKNKKPCGGQWFAGPWSGCSATCGIAMRTRDVLCMKRLSSTLLSPVKHENCVQADKPVSEEQCADLGPCPPEWFMTEWEECSASCGTGVRTRELKCLYPSLKPSGECPEKSKPSQRQTCNKHSCHRTRLDKDPGCKDKYASFCVMVVQARLCSYHYYKERCCLSCRNHS